MRSDQPTKVVSDGEPTRDTSPPTVIDGAASIDAPSQDETPLLLRGTSVGRYVIIDTAGHGGMGAVYLAYDPELDRRVAVKLLRRTDLEAGGDQSLLMREAKAMAKLSHPNVVGVFDVGEHDGQLFVAMEYVEGDTFKRWLEDEPRGWEEILGAFIEAGRGLAAAHEMGIVHRDFKPGNVMIDSSGRCRVLDFGLAVPDAPDHAQRMNSSDHVRIALEGSSDGAPEMVMGTPAYMSPEQWLGAQIDARSDQFSFSVALWDAVYGGKPFVAEQLHDLRRAVLRGETTEPGKVRGPAALRKYLTRGLATSRDDRYPSMDALLTDLESVRGSAARRTTATFAIVGAVVLLGVGYAAAEANRTEEDATLCADAGDRLAGVWDDDRRDAVREAFENTGATYATNVWTTVQRSLDTYSDAWVETHTQTCRSTYVTHEQSEELLDRRMFCLNELRDDLRATVDLFARADTAVVQSAVRSSEALSAVQRCSYARVSTASIEPPAPEVADRVDAIYAELTRARALGLGGRPVEADELLESGIAKARETGYAHLVYKGLMFRSDLRAQNGRAAEAIPSAHGALEAAIAANDDEGTLRSSIMLIATNAISGEFEEAERWLAFSEAWMARPDAVAPVSELGAMLQMNRALLRAAQGKLEEAEAIYTECVPLAREVWSDSTLRIANLVNNLGSVEGMQGKHDESLVHLEEAYTLYKDALGARHPLSATAQANIAGTMLARGDLEKALPEFETALEIKREALGEDNPDVGTAYHNVGTVLSSLGRNQEALTMYERALSTKVNALGDGHTSVAVTRSNLGSVLSDLGRHADALQQTGKAVTVLRELGSDHPYTLNAELAHGQALLGIGRVELALQRLQLVVDSHRKESHDDRQFAEAEFALARALWSTDPSDPEIEPLLDSARNRWAALGPSANPEIARIDAWRRDKH